MFSGKLFSVVMNLSGSGYTGNCGSGNTDGAWCVTFLKFPGSACPWATLCFIRGFTWIQETGYAILADVRMTRHISIPQLPHFYAALIDNTLLLNSKTVLNTYLIWTLQQPHLVNYITIFLGFCHSRSLQSWGNIWCVTVLTPVMRQTWILIKCLTSTLTFLPCFGLVSLWHAPSQSRLYTEYNELNTQKQNPPRVLVCSQMAHRNVSQ